MVLSSVATRTATAGEVWAWGGNWNGQLGNSINIRSDNPSPPSPVSSLAGIVAIAGGERYSLAQRSDGTVWAWGFNGSGELGNSTNSGTTNPNPAPAQVSGLTGIAAIAAGARHGLALRGDRTVWAWGSNSYGQLGNSTNSGTSRANPTPTQVGSLAGVVAIAGGDSHSLALKSDGTVWAWGDNLRGRLGNSANIGAHNPNPTPAQVGSLAGVVAIAGGDSHSLALKSDGSVWAWGDNYQGQLGNSTNSDTTKPNPTPLQVSGLTGVVAIAAGFGHSLALRSDGTVWAWGTNLCGQLGNSTNSGNRFRSNPTPLQVSGLTGVVAIAAGSDHSLAVKSDGTVWAWGVNTSGQLGNRTNTGTSSPNPKAVQVSSLSGVAAIAAGFSHSLAIKGSVAPPVPLINSGGVVGAGLSSPTVLQVSPNALISIFGQNFALPGIAQIVAASDLMPDGTLPTDLIGVCVTVDNQPAPMIFVGSDQLNVQVPTLAGSGNVLVQVITGCDTASSHRSNVEMAALQAKSPEFFTFVQNPDGKNPIAALFANSSNRVGATSLADRFPGSGVTFTPAKPGDLVSMFATGLGLTDPAFAAGALPPRGASTVDQVTVTIGGITLANSDVLYAGAAPGFAGLYQINIRIPAAVPDGDLPVVASVGGFSTPPGAFLTVRR